MPRKAFTNRWILTLAILFANAAWPADAQAQTTGGETDEITTLRLTVSPAAEPRPALKYHFLVQPVDQIRANAAIFYYKALVIDGPDWMYQWYADEKMQSWLILPIAELPIEEMRKQIGPALSGEFTAALRSAARADYCNWEDPIREFGVNTLLPAVQRMRLLARALSLIARLQLAEHHQDEAIETMRLGYALSRNLGHAPSVVQSLVGMAFEGELNDTARALIAEVDSPNLYWALTELATQPVELRQALSYETQVWEFTIHGLADLERRTLTPEEAMDIVRQTQQIWQSPSENDRKGFWTDSRELALVAAVLAIEPEARAYLVEHGFTAAQVNAMPLAQRALLYRWRQFAEVRDNYFKWALLPDDEAPDRIYRANAEDLRIRQADAGVPFSRTLPTVLSCFNAQLRKQREINLLRAVEALRMYAAEHQSWPKSLADVTAVPVPIDPVTQKPFEYSPKGGLATLTAPSAKQTGGYFSPLAGSYFSAQGLRYELTLRQATDKK